MILPISTWGIWVVAILVRILHGTIYDFLEMMGFGFKCTKALDVAYIFCGSAEKLLFSVLCVIISKKMGFGNLNFIICSKVVAIDQVKNT